MSSEGRPPEIVGFKDRPWYIGVQVHPELKSKLFDPRPLFRDFVRAAPRQSKLVQRRWATNRYGPMSECG
jgi:CTP synthase